MSEHILWTSAPLDVCLDDAYIFFAVLGMQRCMHVPQVPGRPCHDPGASPERPGGGATTPSAIQTGTHEGQVHIQGLKSTFRGSSGLAKCAYIHIYNEPIMRNLGADLGADLGFSRIVTQTCEQTKVYVGFPYRGKLKRIAFNTY